MAFLIFCIVAALIIQIVILFVVPARYRKIRYFSLLLLELLPLGGAYYYAACQPYIPYLGWAFYAAMCLWIAAGILVGYCLAWGIYWGRTR